MCAFWWASCNRCAKKSSWPALTSILKPLAWALPLLALGIWWAVRGSVRPLEQLGRAVATRQP